MNELGKLLNQLRNDDVSKKASTGAAGVSNEPESLFYGVFSRADAVAFRDIYKNYHDYHQNEEAAEKLKENLRSQCDNMNSPVEILLFPQDSFKI